MPEQWSSSALESLLEHSVGGVWGKEVGGDDIDVSVVRSTNFTADGNPNLHDVARRSITQKQLVSRELREGDILLEKSGGGPKQPVGRVLFINQDMPETVCANFVQLVRCDKAKILPKFLFLKFWLDHSNGVTERFQAATTGIRNLRTKDYLARTLNFPPIAEQRRIVDLVESIDNHIDALQGQIDATRTARQGVLSDLMSNLGDDWQLANLAEVATVVVGPALKSEIYHSCNDGIPVVRGINIGTDGFRWEETVFWPEDECAGYEQFFLTEGQTIIPMDRPFRPNGQLRLAMVQQGDLPLLLNQRVAAIAAGPHISEGFLYAIACSPDFANKLSGGLTGAYAPHLAKKDFENMSIAIPSMSEQHQITDLVQSFDEQISALETQIDAARATRSGVLSDLLSGDRLLDESYDKAVGL